MHLGVEALENDSDYDYADGCNREGEGDYFGRLAKLLIEDLLGDTGQGIEAGDEGGWTLREAEVVEQEVVNVADRAHRVG